MFNLKYFLALAVISIASCDVYVPQKYWNAKPMSQHPKLQEIFKQLSANVLETRKDPFIIGGSPAVRGQFPHFVLMLDIYANDTAYVCGGSIIHRQWVLTTGTCIDRAAMYFDLYTGIVNITGPASWGTRVSQADARTHPQFDLARLRNDLGMIKLIEAPYDLLSYPYTGKIELPTEAVDLVSLYGSVSGFGITYENATYASNNLNYNSLRVMTNAICATYFVIGSVLDSHICAETNGTVSTCSSDMGGPYSFVINGVNRLEGVISFYASPGCEHGYPVGFTRVSYFLGWIDDTITGRNPDDDLWNVLRDLQEQYLVTLQNIIEGSNSLSAHDEH